MNDLERFLELIGEHAAEADFVGPRDESLIRAGEEALSLSFPPTYRRFVEELGAGDVAGQEFYGIITDEFVESSVPDGVWLTLKGRDEWRLPESMVVVGFDGGVDFYVIDTAKVSHGHDPPFEVWRPRVSSDRDHLERVASDFGEFALRLTSEGLGVR